MDSPAVVPPPTVPPSPPPVTPQKPVIPLLLMILFFLALAATIILAIQNWQLNQRLNAIISTSTPTPSPTPSEANPPLAETPTSTKTISSPKFGYRVEIPGDWNQIAAANEDESMFNFRKGDYEISLIVIPTTAKTIQIYLEQADKDAQTGWEGQPTIRVISTKLTKINDFSVVRREEEWLAAGFIKPVVNTYFLNQRIYSFTLKYIGPSPNPAITETAAYDQVLSTFQLTN